jgi:hypothetical protein
VHETSCKPGALIVMFAFILFLLPCWLNYRASSGGVASLSVWIVVVAKQTVVGVP